MASRSMAPNSLIKVLIRNLVTAGVSVAAGVGTVYYGMTLTFARGTGWHGIVLELKDGS